MILLIKAKVRDDAEAHEVLAEVRGVCEVFEAEFNDTIITYRKKEK